MASEGEGFPPTVTRGDVLQAAGDLLCIMMRVGHPDHAPAWQGRADACNWCAAGTVTIAQLLIGYGRHLEREEHGDCGDR